MSGVCTSAGKIRRAVLRVIWLGASKRKRLSHLWALGLIATLALTGLLLVGPSHYQPAQAATQTRGPAVPGEIIVGFKERVSERARDGGVSKVHAARREQIRGIDAEVVGVDALEADET